MGVSPLATNAYFANCPISDNPLTSRSKMLGPIELWWSGKDPFHELCAIHGSFDEH